MIDIKKYCEYLYNSYFFPLYIYENKKLSACYPAQEAGTLPPTTYLSSLWETEKNLTYIVTKFYTYYGCIQVENSNSYIVIGPISTLPYSKEILMSMRKEYSIEETNWESFYNFFSNITTQTLHIFINTLLFINYTINNIELCREDIEYKLDSSLNISITKKYLENSHELIEEDFISNSYSIECEFLRYIETGNMDGFKKFAIQMQNLRIGTIAHNNLRQLKNTFIVAVALVSRASIRGGLSPKNAYNLADIYIQQMEKLMDMNAINSLLKNALYDFASRTANAVLPLGADPIIHRVIQYVRENTNKNITVAQIADHFGFNRSYLSRKAKKQLGIDLSTFISQCKLEEAKDLLAYSDKSISEISNHLCFSSQSHFQRAFKKQFEITPQAYRNSV